MQSAALENFVAAADLLNVAGDGQRKRSDGDRYAQRNTDCLAIGSNCDIAGNGLAGSGRIGSPARGVGVAGNASPSPSGSVSFSCCTVCTELHTGSAADFKGNNVAFLDASATNFVAAHLGGEFKAANINEGGLILHSNIGSFAYYIANLCLAISCLNCYGASDTLCSICFVSRPTLGGFSAIDCIYNGIIPVINKLIICPSAISPRLAGHSLLLNSNAGIRCKLHSFATIDRRFVCL